MAFIFVRHNIEVAHRLIELPGKCEQIHGHSMWVELTIHGHIDQKGLLDGLDFGGIKKHFRQHLDTQYDHHLLLNEKDPWAQPVYVLSRTSKVFAETDGKEGFVRFKADVERMLEGDQTYLPGLVMVPGDPTTENIAKWISQWAADEFNHKVDVIISETNTNGAGATALPRNGAT